MHDKRVYCLFLALLLAALGCGRGGARTYPVSGTVRYQGKPLPLGVVMLVPNEGPSCKPASIDPQGRYRLEAAAGEYRAAVVAVPPREGGRPDATREGGFDYTGVPEPKPLIPAKYSRHATSGITVVVRPGGADDLDIDLE